MQSTLNYHNSHCHTHNAYPHSLTSRHQDLLKDLKKELSGEFENVVMALMTRTTDFLAKELEHAVELKNGEAIVQILFTCETPELR